MATALMASGRHGLSPRPVVWFSRITFVFPYWFSVCLHFIPWRERTAHDLALVLDFTGISMGYSGQTAAWVGGRDLTSGGTRSSTLVAWAARLNVLSTVALVGILAAGVANRKNKPIMLHARRTRFGIMAVNMLLLGFVETMKMQDARLNLFIQLWGKLFVPWYFVTCVAVDATRRGPLPLWHGVWEGHEYWHCFILLLHLTQLYALMRHYGTWTYW